MACINQTSPLMDEHKPLRAVLHNEQVSIRRLDQKGTRRYLAPVYRYCNTLMRYGAACLISLTGQAAPFEERPLRFGVTDTWAMPLLQSSGAKVTGGILFDFGQQLAESVGRQFEVVALPRRRIQELMNEHQIDVLCYVNPAWLEEIPANFVWSAPFMEQRDVVVGRNPERLRPEALKGQVVGAVLGFVYPSLDLLFAGQQLIREDARTQEQVLLKLEVGRYRYAVSDKISLDYFNAKRPVSEHLWPTFDVASYSVSCLVSSYDGVPTQALLKNIEHLKEAGLIEKMVEGYR